MTNRTSGAAYFNEVFGPLILLGVSNVLVHQVAPNLFSATDINDFLYKNEQSADPLSEGIFSRFGDIEQFRSSDGLFYSRVEYSNGAFAEFSHSNNPLTEPRADHTLIAGGGSGFAGMGPRTGTGQAWFDGNPNAAQWWWAVGTSALFTGNSIPANEPNTATSVTYSVTKVN